ncbi:TonB-dependent receptor domain-containing protein [Cerasicoccus arenae]|uniref:TonB-dependent receptor n=1 Tax=Cerasicoccus arenae TaxID=424488 RepID=A0A8J3DBB0_9BACT|nr:TonB-dependent receptor [Cerasicoccus arenae]MBK1858696.1 TonB-dependent receptor [Cerasicoccus arenae]GHB98371.1 TonB-dependent receptor [Cerasicoccus arenae]
MTTFTVGLLTATAQVVPEPIAEPALYELAPVYMTGSLFTPNEGDPNETFTTLKYEDLILMGNQMPIESLRMLPSFYGAMNTENDSNGGTGASSPNIHALGTLRTLNLINGRRAGGNSALGLDPGGFANLNLIPQAAIREIDILQETASTTYGSDAIGGVVNIGLDNRFQGVRLDGLYGNTTDGGGQLQQYSMIAGFNLDEDTHLTLLGSYFDQQVVWARDRDLSATTNFIPLGGTNRGSSTFPGRANFLFGGSNVNGVLAPGIPFPTTGADYVPYNQNTDALNYNNQAPDIPALRIASIFAAIEHNLTDQVTLYGEALFSYQNQANGLASAPWGAYPGTPIFTAAQNSPHNPVPAADLFSVTYRNFELGTLNTRFERNAFRLVGGARGLVDDRWEWDTAVLYTQTELTNEVSGIADARLLIPHINSGLFNPFARAVAGNNAGVPFNNYVALNAASVDAKDQFYENMFSYDAKVSGDLVKLPAGDLEGAFGLEYRYESIDATPDSLWASGQNLGGGGFTQNYSGQRNVAALFSEINIPLISPKQSITAVNRLDLSLGLRFENFSDTGNDPITGISAPNGYRNLSWKAAISLKPVESVTLRAAYSTGFRAPTLYESYAGEIYDYPILVDSTGATPPGTPIPTLVRGNPSLDPETSNNFSASAIWEPDFAEGLTLRASYYYIRVDDAIANGAQYTLDQNNPADVIRAGPNGPVVFVTSRFFNVSSLTTQGMDYEASYDRKLTEDIRMRLSMGVNQVISFEADVPGTGDVSFAGRYVDKRSNNLSPGAVPRWKGLASANLFVHQAMIGATVQYIGSYEDDPSFTLGGMNRTVESYTKVNLVAGYEFENTQYQLLNGTKIMVGVDNVFNTEPPFAAGAFADGYDTSLYSIENRFVYGSISKKF